MTRTLIIVGSSRKGGDTFNAAKVLNALLGVDIIELIDYRIGHYDYAHGNDDDFRELITRVIAGYDTLIFATPVYWYSMSGIMKDFFDRITDLLDTDKDLGRKLRGKNMAVLSSSAGDHLGEDFWHPFKAIARYLRMPYLGDAHTVVGADVATELQPLAAGIREAQSATGIGQS